MQQLHSGKLRKRLLSTFLAILLFLGNLSYPILPAEASANTISDNDSQFNVNGSPVSPDEDISTPPNDAVSDIPDSSSEAIDPSDEDAAQAENPPFSDDASESEQNSENFQSDERTTEQSEDTDAGTADPAAGTDDESLDQSQASDTTYIITFDYNGYLDADGKSFCQFTAKKNDYLDDYLQQAQTKILDLSPQKIKNWVEYKTVANASDNSDAALSSELEATGKTRKSGTTKLINANYTYKAQWDNYKTYSIDYYLNGGSFVPDSDKPATNTYTYNDEEIILPKEVQKKGYLFQGFYKDSAFKTGVVTSIPHNSMGDIKLYAKWESAKPKSAPVLKKATNPSNGKVKVTFQKMKDISGYEFLMSTSKNFKKNTNKISLEASATSTQLTNMPKGKTYYFKMRAYRTDSVGEKAYSKYSNSLKLKISKGVAEYKATSTSAKLKKCSVTKQNMLNVTFTVSKRLKSSDDSYYLVALDPNTNKYSKKIASMPKVKSVVFELPIRDEEGTDLIHGKYALAVKSGSSYQIVSKSAFISNPEAAATYTGAFPKSHSKKGMQGSIDADLGLSHTFINIDLNQYLAGSNSGAIPYKYNGKTYYFNDPYESFISSCNASGLTVTGQIMLTYNSSTKYMILKGARTSGKAYYAINVQEKKARETFEAVTSFMAERYSQKDCHLDNWIIGNEVNIYPMWYYAGNITKGAFMKNYASTFRILYYSVRSHSKNSRVYICTDHTWNNRSGDWGAKPFMDTFNSEIKSQQKNIQWNLAYHAYPAILTSAATWRDSHAPDNDSADFVTPKNLNVLTNYVKKKFGSKTRIILSEQGFTATSGTDVQAAAIAYTYYKAEFNTMIDAVIFRSEIDHSVETAQGLYFGLKNLAGKNRPAYNVFKYMDTPNAEKYTTPYLNTIGISKWKDIAPKYTLSRFK